MKKNSFAVILLSFIFAYLLIYDLKLAIALLLMVVCLCIISRSELAIINIYFFIYLTMVGFADSFSISLSGHHSINFLGILNLSIILFFYVKLTDFLQLRKEYWNKSVIYPIFLLTLYLVLTIPFSLSLTATIRGLIRTLSAFSFYLLTYFIVVNNKNNIENKIFKFLTVIFILLSICGIIEYFTGFNVFYSSSILNQIYLGHVVIQQFARIKTSFLYPPNYSFALLIFLPLCLYYFMKKKESLCPYGLIIILVLINLLLTFTRIAWVAVAIQLIFFLFLFKPKKILRFALPLGIILVCMSSQIIARGTTVDQSALQRFVLFWYGFSIFKAHPVFGSGIGTFFELSAFKFGSNIAAHGDYMLMFAETGIFGGIGYLILLFTKLVFAVKNFKENDFAKVTFLMLISFMIFSVTSNALANSHIFWGLLGIYNGLIIRENVRTYALSPELVKMY